MSLRNTSSIPSASTAPGDIQAGWYSGLRSFPVLPAGARPAEPAAFAVLVIEEVGVDRRGEPGVAGRSGPRADRARRSPGSSDAPSFESRYSLRGSVTIRPVRGFIVAASEARGQ